VRELVRRVRRRLAAARPPEETWFRDHFETAPREIGTFLRGADLDLAELRVADLGCGDGIMALGVALKLKPAELVGFDVNRTDVDGLLQRARARRVTDGLPDNLSFVQCTATELPAPDGSFDVVYTWSAFEHVHHPVDVLREIKRVLTADGVLFLQLWPFYLSERGSHLWNWFPRPFHHLLDSYEEIEAEMRSCAPEDDFMTNYMLDEFKNLNRITVDELQTALLAAGFDIVRLELLTHLVGLEPELARRHRLSDLGVAGVKLLARPATPSVAREPSVTDDVTRAEQRAQQ
jgi:ubiquinone/menaquinone biosynthesis C-methylase UbiE